MHTYWFYTTYDTTCLRINTNVKGIHFLPEKRKVSKWINGLEGACTVLQDLAFATALSLF